MGNRTLLKAVVVNATYTSKNFPGVEVVVLDYPVGVVYYSTEGVYYVIKKTWKPFIRSKNDFLMNYEIIDECQREE